MEAKPSNKGSFPKERVGVKAGDSYSEMRKYKKHNVGISETPQKENPSTGRRKKRLKLGA